MSVTYKTNHAFFQPPKEFSPLATVVSIICHDKGKFLFLKKAYGHQKGNWGLPGGKLERGEKLKSATQRELIEETGIFVRVAEMSEIGQFYMRTRVDFTIHLFATDLKTSKTPYLSKEHNDYRWMTIEEALKLPLLVGQDEVLRYFQNAYANAF